MKFRLLTAIMMHRIVLISGCPLPDISVLETVNSVHWPVWWQRLHYVR